MECHSRSDEYEQGTMTVNMEHHIQEGGAPYEFLRTSPSFPNIGNSAELDIIVPSDRRLAASLILYR